MTHSFTPARRALATGLALLCALPAAWALDKPAGAPVLTLSGKISATNADKKAVFDAAMLAALPQHSFTTSTPWYKAPVKFTGPLLSDVLRAAKASGTTLRAVALNDYKVAIPAEDATRFKVIVARLIDDKPIPVREKGPLFVVYPFDSDSELRTTKYYDRSIWQLKAIEVE
jgi:hypothetical protein